MKRRIVYRNWSGGMFSMVKSIMCALKDCEDAGVEPIVEVAESPFREDGYKGNVWDRFFDPIGNLSDAPDQTVEISSHPCFPTNDCWFHNRAVGHRLIERWIRPRPVLRARIDQWQNKLKEAGCFLAIHYRGTDKTIETTFVAPTHYQSVLESLRADMRFTSWLLCTDAAPVVEQLKHISGMIATDSVRGGLRQTHGVHFSAPDRGKAGDDAILDAWLLASCRYMVCGPSNLNEFSTYLNPTIVVISMR